MIYSCKNYIKLKNNLKLKKLFNLLAKVLFIFDIWYLYTNFFSNTELALKLGKRNTGIKGSIRKNRLNCKKKKIIFKEKN